MVSIAALTPDLRYHVFYIFSILSIFLYVESARSRHDGYGGRRRRHDDVLAGCWLLLPAELKLSAVRIDGGD